MAALTTCTAFAFVLLMAAPAIGQEGDASRTVVQVRLVNEVASDRSNPEGLTAAGPAGWNTLDFGLAAVDGSWNSGGRLRLGGAVAVFGDTAGNLRARVREGYVRLSATNWLDVEGGKRILKWGTGYAFTPTGVLDPPRDPADPRDRLGVNEGVMYGGATFFRSDTALSIVGASPDTWRSSVAGTPHWVAAARLRTLVRGVETAVVASATDTTAPSWGVNFTHVVGQGLELHGELLVHRRALLALPPGVALPASGDREASVLVGCQYTFTRGVNVVLEYYHDGNGLDQATWQRLTGLAALGEAATGAPATGATGTGSSIALPGLRHFAFVRAAPAATEPKLLPEMLAIVGLDDGSVTLVPGLTWTAQIHLQLYARGTILAGRPDSVVRLGASRGGVQVGAAARF